MKEYLAIAGGKRLSGSVAVSGAKNAALPLMMAALLSDKPCVLENVPDLEDTSVTIRLLRRLGAVASYADHRVNIHAEKITTIEAPHGLVKAMRASFWILGPLLARTGEARVALPGGDAIGTRPVDLHIKGLVQFGAEIRIQHGTVVASAPGGLSPAQIELAYPSVGATHHLMMTAALIDGETEISGAAREPEIVELGNFLSSMGVDVSGAGSTTVVVRGRSELGPGRCRLEADRIEASTYLIAGAVTGGCVTVTGVREADVEPVLKVLSQAGCEISVDEAHKTVTLRAAQRLKAVNFNTEPFPGVPTDAQPLLMAALSLADGSSIVAETVFESRFGHVPEFRRFGAKIDVNGRVATVHGVRSLNGAIVEGGDIRAAASLVIMGLAAPGESQVLEIHHLDRGYERMVEKFQSLGASVTRVPAFGGKEIVIGC